MNIIIIGAGEVGYQIARRLVLEEHNITIIENNAKRIEEINQKLDVLTLQGYGSDLKVLEKAGIADCDILIATTSVDEINMIVCFIAKKYNVHFKIARIRNQSIYESWKTDSYSLSPEELGLDVVINPEQASVERILRLIKSSEAFEDLQVLGSGFYIKGFKITSSSLVTNMTIKQLATKYPKLTQINILAIIRDNDILIPSGDDVILLNDKIYVIAKNENFTWIASFFNEVSIKIRRVFIARVSPITELLCEQFLKLKMSIKVFEEDSEKSIQFAKKFPKVDVICAKSNNMDILREEGLDKIDAFIALSDDEETNILSCMLAKKAKVKRTLAKIQNQDYISFASSSVGIDVIINPKISTVGEILKLIRKEGSFISIDALGTKIIETFSYTIHKEFKHLNIPIKNIKFPPSTLVAGIRRNDEHIIPRGDDHLNIGDEVILFTYLESMKTLDCFFSI